jgi:hypothetical protein
MRFFLALLLLIPSVARAHAVTLAYVDIRPATEASPMVLTVAIHPHQALLLVGATHGEGEEAFGFADQIPELQEHADVIGAYLQTHFRVSANGTLCTWEPTRVDVPGTELESLADGVSMSAPLICEGESKALDIESTLFTDAFAEQQTVVRIETPEGFAERLLLDRETTSGSIDISEQALADVVPSEAVTRPPTSDVIQIAGWIVLGVAVLVIAIVAYRTNIASPKE